MKEKFGNFIVTFPTYVAQYNDDGHFEVGKWNVLDREYQHLEYADSFSDAKERARLLNEEEEE